VRFLRQF